MDKLKSKKAILVAIIVAILSWAGYTVTENDVNQYVDIVMPNEGGEVQQEAQKIEPAKNEPVNTRSQQVKEDFNRASVISDQRRTHILYGDATGGGHLHGTGKPCKSEFPAHWDEETILKEVELIASNDNLSWEQQRNGYHVVEQKVGIVKVRVVKGRDNEQVITAYPVNVPRNPCPSNDNY